MAYREPTKHHNHLNTSVTKQSSYYAGHSISSDNDLISQKLLLKSEFYYQLHVAMGVAYSCLEYGVFITS